MSIPKSLAYHRSPVAISAGLAVALLLVAGFAPLSPAVTLAVYLGALLVGVAGLILQRQRNYRENGDSE